MSTLFDIVYATKANGTPSQAGHGCPATSGK